MTVARRVGAARAFGLLISLACFIPAAACNDDDTQSAAPAQAAQAANGIDDAGQDAVAVDPPVVVDASPAAAIDAGPAPATAYVLAKDGTSSPYTGQAPVDGQACSLPEGATYWSGPGKCSATHCGCSTATGWSCGVYPC